MTKHNRTLLWSGVSTIVGVVFLRAISVVSPLPHWDINPFLSETVMTGVGPGGSMLLDLLAILGATLVLIGVPREWRPGPLVTTLAIAGTLGVLAHSWVPGLATQANRWTGSPWIAGIFCALAMRSAAHDRTVVHFTLAAFIALIGVLIGKGVYQVFVEHPLTVADFEERKIEILAAQGWTPDSPMARAFEHRLRQPDITGWFGLSNVFATFMAAAIAGLAACVASARKADWTAGVLAIALLGAVWALVTTNSKGGIIATVLACIALALLWLVVPRLPKPTTKSRVAGLVGPLLLAAGPVMVITRALLGDRLTELSLLVRWFYMQGSARIAGEHPILGVGPAGFQDAYLTVRPPLSTEEVASPHCLTLDWWATLGVPGLAWCAFLVILAIGIGRRAIEPDAGADQPNTKRSMPARLLILVIAFGVLFGARLESNILGPTGALVWVGFLFAAWIIGLAAWEALNTSDRAGRLTAAGVALALLAQSQVDVAGVQPSSATLLLMLVGLAAAPTEPPKRTVHTKLLAPAAIAVAIAVAIGSLVALRWGASLEHAAEPLKPIPTWRTRLQTEGRVSPTVRAEIAGELSRFTGQRVTPENVFQAFMDAQLAATRESADRLDAAIELEPSEWKVRREAAQLRFRYADLLGVMGRDAGTSINDALATWGGPPSDERPAAEIRAYALALEVAFSATGDEKKRDEARLQLRRVMAKDPLNLPVAVRLAELADAAGDAPDAATWAREALRLHDLKEHEIEMKGLTATERAEMMRLADPP